MINWRFWKNKRLLVLISVVTAVAIALVILLILVGTKKDDDKSDKNETVSKEDESEPLVLDTTLIGDPSVDPQNMEEQENEVSDKTDESEDHVERENKVVETGRSHGIDVSKWQGKIDWKKVRDSGIEFAFIRIGYRGENGVIYRDETADYNIQQAHKQGILVGTYFFSTATSKQEAEEEAKWTLKAIEGYPISYPVVYDCEGYKKSDSRMYGITMEQRTEYALAYLKIIAEAGYDPMFYGARNDMESADYWDMSQIDNRYKVWVAHYPTVSYPQRDKPDYVFPCHAWQYTNKGKIDGITGNVDLVVCYFTKQQEEAKEPDAGPDEEAEAPPEQDVVAGHVFTAKKDQVTAKEFVNLRALPNTESDIIGALNSGEFLERTAVSNKGWSRLIYNGQAVYAVTSYLTNEVVQRPNSPEVDDEGFQIVNEQVTAKDATNLRTAPSTEEGKSEVLYKLPKGEYVKRIGVHTNGWSKLEYNGQVVYAISSYLTIE